MRNMTGEWDESLWQEQGWNQSPVPNTAKHGKSSHLHVMTWIYLRFSYKIRAKKESLLCTISMSLHCSPFKCTAKASLIIKDWFKRLFHSKHWAWLMLHIISLLSFTASLHVYHVPHSPSAPAPNYSRAAGPEGWAHHNNNPECSSSSCLITEAQHSSHLASEPKQHPPKALGQVFADLLS